MTERYNPAEPVDFETALYDLMVEHQHTLIDKNTNYGDNLLYFGLRGVMMRLHDKYKRLETLVMREQPDLVGESVEDTLLDLSGYCLVALAHMRMGDMTIDGAWRGDDRPRRQPCEKCTTIGTTSTTTKTWWTEPGVLVTWANSCLDSLASEPPCSPCVPWPTATEDDDD